VNDTVCVAFAAIVMFVVFMTASSIFSVTSPLPLAPLLAIVADIVTAVPTSTGLAENVNSEAVKLGSDFPQPVTLRLVTRMSANAKIDNILDFMFTPFCIIEFN
jgi:hypothetical protein